MKKPISLPPLTLSGDATFQQGPAAREEGAAGAVLAGGEAAEQTSSFIGPLILLVFKGIGRVLARCCESSPREEQRNHATFKPTVVCYQVPDLCELDADAKRQLWWSKEDFESFLARHTEIAEAYKLAVERDEADSFKYNPALCNDSRRGLGLGRSDIRATNSDTHFCAVLDEQQRQWETGEVDPEALARASRAASAAEVQYSISNARRDAEEARAYLAEATSKGPKGRARRSLTLPMEAVQHLLRPDETPDDDTMAVYRRHCTEPLMLVDSDDEVLLSPSNRPAVSKTLSKDSARGFGLSPNQLLEAGVLASGRTSSSCGSPRRRLSTGSPIVCGMRSTNSDRFSFDTEEVRENRRLENSATLISVRADSARRLTM